MEAVSVNISGRKFGVSKVFTTFEMQTGCRFLESQPDIFITADKAGLLRRFYSSSLDRSANFQGRLASLCLHINQILSQMQTGKNLTANARGASKSRVCGAKSVSPLHTFRVKLSSEKAHAKFAGLKNLCIFAVRRNHGIVYQSSDHTYSADKAGLILGISFGNNRCDSVARIGNSSAYSYIHTSNF